MAQNQLVLKGVVNEKNNKGILEPIVGAQIQWLGEPNGVLSDAAGFFEITKSSSSKQLLIRCIGFINDTIALTDEQIVRVLLVSKTALKEVSIQYEKKSTEISFIDPWKTTTMNEKELFKSACCNLSESFETNPSVDVSYSDALTGTKQIQLLGLATQYTQLTQEMTPGTRGIASQIGYGYTPGTWIKSIQVTKGIGSIVNGFESIAGQINTELHQPDEPEKVFINGYYGAGGRAELNLIVQEKTNQKFSQSILLHTNNTLYGTDHNHDGFLDNPIGNQINGMYRFKFENKKGFMVQGGFRALGDSKNGGQTNQTTDSIYATRMSTNRKEFWLKTGYVFPQKIYKSIGLQVQLNQQGINTSIGKNFYSGLQASNYLNLIYQSIIANSNHKFKTGLSFLNDQYNEVCSANADTQFMFMRNDYIPGLFYEYTAVLSPRITMVAGVRADLHSLFGFFTTPRFHLKYTPIHNIAIRLSAGKGQRTASVLGENMGLLASSRKLIIPGSNQNNVKYAIQNFDQERAWNLGGSFTWNFELNYRKAMLSLDYFYTLFENQVIIDRYQSPYEVYMYQLKNASYAHSFQIQMDAEPLKHLDIRLAYRFLKTGFERNNVFYQQPLIAQHRAFLIISYQTYHFWNFDYTIQWNGQKQLPLLVNEQAQTLEQFSTPFFIHHFQVSKSFKKKAGNAIYVGVENLFNFMQDNAIVNAANPWAKNFDASAVWGPIFGTMWYMGFRWRL